MTIKVGIYAFGNLNLTVNRIQWPGGWSFTPSDTSGEQALHLALLIPNSGDWAIAPHVAGAAALAVEQINADDTLLAGLTLEHTWADSGCSAQQGLLAMGELVGGVNQISAIIGPGCRLDLHLHPHLW